MYLYFNYVQSTQEGGNCEVVDALPQVYSITSNTQFKTEGAPEIAH